MARTRKKKRRVQRGGGTAEQFGFVLEGLRMLLGWVATALAALWALLVWTVLRVWRGLTSPHGRQSVGLVLAAVMLFTLVAMLDFRAGAPWENVCGSLGYELADLLLRNLGVGAYVVPVLGAFWGIATLFRRGGQIPGARALGIAGLALAVAVAAHGIAPDALPGRSLPAGPGGRLGSWAFPPLAGALGPFGAAVLLALTALLALMLATEWAFVPLARDLLRRAGRGLRQGELPLEPPKPAIREERERAERGLRRLWDGFLDLLRPYQPPGDSLAMPAAVPGSSARGGKDSRGGAAGAPVEGDAGTAGEDLWAATAGGEEDAWEAGADEQGDEDEAPAAATAGAAAGGGGSGPLPRILRDEEEPRRRRRKPTLGSLPPASILEAGGRRDRREVQVEIDRLGRKLQEVFDAFGLDARVVGAERGPTLTLFEVQLASGVSVKKLKNQRDDLAVSLGSHGVRIVYPLPGRSTVGIEVPNLERENVRLKDVFEEVDLSWERLKLPMVLGRDTLGKPAVEDLTVMPHMLIAGATGSGKSVCLNSILCTWLLTRTPDQVRLVLIDPKQVELQLYRDIPHLLCPVVTDMRRAPFTLEWATRQMEDRLHMFKMAGVRNIGDYNALGRKELQARVGDDYDPEEFPDTLPFYVLVIDELADLMLVSAKEVEIAISRLAAKARAAGIHLVVATQRPSTDVVTGLIKMNLPVRMAFKVTSAVDSRVILDDSGADHLLGNGDFLYRPPGASGMVRGQGSYVSEREVREICDHLRSHGKPEFLEDLVQMKGPGGELPGADDPLFDDAVRIIVQSGRGSASLLQRALSIGYTRASRLIDLMTEQGILGPYTGSKAREVLITLEEWEARQGGGGG